MILQSRENRVQNHWPCSTSVFTSSSSQESGTQIPTKYWSVPYIGKKTRFKFFGLSGWHFIFYNYYFLAFTCLRNTWQYCPEKVGPWAERHCCSKPGWLALPPSTLLPIFPNASYTNTQSTQAPPNNTHTHPNSTLCKEQNSGWLDSLDQKRC